MRIVAISDTHKMHSKVEVPDGDLLIHAGDMTGRGSMDDLYDFCEWLDKQPHPEKIVIAGNHDFCFQREKTRQEAESMMTEVATYLRDSSTIIDGIKFYGSPWQPDFCNWAFNLPRGEPLNEKWNAIDNDTEVLITHGPPQGILDFCPGGNVGDVGLLVRTTELDALRLHIFGHIHESYGVKNIGPVTYMNASNCTGNYIPSNPALVSDLL